MIDQIFWVTGALTLTVALFVATVYAIAAVLMAEIAVLHRIERWWSNWHLDSPPSDRDARMAEIESLKEQGDWHLEVSHLLIRSRYQVSNLLDWYTGVVSRIPFFTN